MPVARIHPSRPWILLGLPLALLLAAALALFVQDSNKHLDEARRAAERELQLIASVLSATLQKGDYQLIDGLLREWGGSNPEIVELTLTAPNGFSLGAYRRAQPGTHSLELSAALTYSYRGAATLKMHKDLTEVYTDLEQLGVELAAAFLLIGLMLGYFVHVGLQRQREAAVLRARTEQLNTANLRQRMEIVQRVQAEEALFEAKERAEVTLHSIGDAVITTDTAGVVTYLNPVAETLTGWTQMEATGRPLDVVFRIFNETTDEAASNPVERCLRDGRIVGLANHTVLVGRDGRKIAIEDSAAPIRDRQGRIVGVVMVFQDVSHTRELAQQLSWQASHDALTGLINRNEFEKRLRHALASARDEGHQHALLYLDLDQFKVVNDTCGHVAGDELLRQLSDLNQAQMRASDTLARLGGDEFGVLLERCPQEQACRVADNLRRNMKDYRFAWENKTFEISASIGVVGIHAGSGDLARVLSAADMACYAAKESGRNRIHVYHESDAELLQRQGEMLWVARVNQALEENRFLLYRQAIVPTNGLSENVEHYEVLLRLRADDGTIIAPGDFIPAAERYNLMPAIDRWVVQNLFIQQGEALRCAPRDAACDCLVAVNLSGASFSDGQFLDFVRAQLRAHAIPPERVCFEITETAAIANLTHATHFMKELRALGCRFSLDDFGSGLSSFGYLKNLPVDFLKIDGALVRHVADNLIDLAMVEAINGIGHVMGMRTIAEFVENQAIREKLVVIGVDYVQGYGVEMPRPLIPGRIGG